MNTPQEKPKNKVCLMQISQQNKVFDFLQAGNSILEKELTMANTLKQMQDLIYQLCAKRVLNSEEPDAFINRGFVRANTNNQQNPDNCLSKLAQLALSLDNNSTFQQLTNHLIIGAPKGAGTAHSTSTEYELRQHQQQTQPKQPTPTPTTEHTLHVGHLNQQED